jgi:hypothetical protein
MVDTAQWFHIEPYGPSIDIDYGIFRCASETCRLGIARWTYTMNCGPWDAPDLFGTIFSLDLPVLWLPPARFFWTHGPLPGLNRLANIPAD